MSVTDIHQGKRQILLDRTIEMLDGRLIFMGLMMSTDGRSNHCLHVQKCQMKNESLEPMKGGIMIDVEYLREMKRIIDEAYNTAIQYDLL